MMEISDYSGGDLQELGAKWMGKIRAASKREEAWIKDAEAAEKAYLVDRDAAEGGEIPAFNILHSNIETIVPALINSQPKPDIRPRHNAPDQGGKQISDLLERAISTQIDDGALFPEIEMAVQDAFMAGRGILRVRLDADVEEQPELDVDGEMMPQPPMVSNERLTFECVSWRDYREGPARRWSDVPWVAFAHYITQEEIQRLEDRDLPVPEGLADSGAGEDEADDVKIWEIWCKETGRIYFIVEHSNRVLRIEPDPLNIKGFFPMVQPLQPITGSGKRTPVCPYSVYKTQAEELDRITKRINKIISGLKVRGLIAGDVSDISQLAEAEDNQLVPVENIEGLVAMGGIDRAVMWWPLETAIMVLQQLYQARESVKATIYELTGISDIVRGASDPRETASAQNIKAKWGSVRIRRMQHAVQRGIRDLFVMSAEIMWRHFSPQTLARAGGMQLTPEIGQALQQPLDMYRIDIESDSTIQASLTESKQEMAEFLNGTANFFAVMEPIIQREPQAAVLASEIYAAFSRQFSLGKQAEDALDQMTRMAQQKAAAGDPQAQEAQQRQQQAFQMEMAERQANVQKAQADAQKAQAQAQNAGAEAAMRQQELQLEVEGKRADLQLKAADLQLKERELGVKVRKQQFDEYATAAEIEMEAQQRRPVVFGG